MFKVARTIFVAAVAACLWMNGAQAEQAAAPNLSGTYECTPNPTPCPPGATTFTLTQSGNKVEFKSDNGLVGGGMATSPITIAIVAPWNMLGVVQKDGQIHWPNGTIWRKK
jgi:hypothetical protein